jgi:hypothetical protein
MFIIRNLIIENAYSRYFYILTERRGNRQTARETEKESVRENERCGKMDIGVRHKTGCWKNPLTSFWDKLGRINFFRETILMEEKNRKDTLRLNILRYTLGNNWYNDMSHILHTAINMILPFVIAFQLFDQKLPKFEIKWGVQ